MSVCPNCQSTYADELRYCGKCGSDMTHPPPHLVSEEDPWIGAVVENRYRVLALLGQGGMGSVYKVEHVRMGKLAAMKILRRDLTGDRDALKRFKREAEAVSRLSHPNTVQVFDFGQAEGALFIVMELLRGEDLGALVRRDGPLLVPRALRLLVQTCNALAEAHDLGIVHRDLKPENIVLCKSREGRESVKVLDFGLAKVREREELAEVTGRGTVLGTPYYMSPEQIRAENLDQRTDIYSLGGVAYKLLTGETPFQAQTPLGVLTKHLMDPLQPPSERRPDLAIDPAIDRVLLKALAKKRDERYGRIEEFRDDLQAVRDALRERQQARSAESSSVPQAVHAQHGDASGAIATEASGDVAPLSQAERLRREDFDAFERRLRFARGVRLALLPVLLVGGLAAAYFVKQRLAGPLDVEQEPNNDPASANAIANGGPIRGTMGRRVDFQSSDRDFFHFTIPAHAPEQLLALHLTGIQGIDLVLEVWDAQKRIGYADNNGSGYGEVIPNLGLPPGDYWLCVREVMIPGKAAIEDLEDDYTLTARWHDRAATEEIEPDDDPTRALPAPLGAPITGYLGRRNDIDWYLPQGHGGGTLAGKVSGIAGVDMLVRVIERSGPGAAPTGPVKGGKPLPPAPVAKDNLRDILSPRLPASLPASAVPPTGRVFDEGGVAQGESFTVPWPAGAPAPLVVVERKDPKADAASKNGEPVGLDSSYSLSLSIER